MRVGIERGISYPKPLRLVRRLRASVQLWGLSRALTQTMGGAIVLWITAISRTRLGLREKDFIKQKVLVSVWTRASRDRIGNGGPPSRGWRISGVRRGMIGSVLVGRRVGLAHNGA
jgi:hypothetical protein